MPKVATPKPKEIKEEPKLYCLCCGSANQDNFYLSRNPLNKFFGKIPYCKNCIKGVMWKYYVKRYHGNEQMALHGLLRGLNLPYIHSIYQSAIKTMENPDSTLTDLISAYMKSYNSLYTKNNYGDSYADSEGLGEIEGISLYEDNISIKRKRKDIKKEDIDTEKYEVLEYEADDLVNKWGEFEDEKLIKLELEWLDWSDKLGDYINDKSVELVVRQVCYQTVEIQEKRERGEKVKDEITALQTLLNGSGLIEKTREKNAETVQIGQTIREIETHRPIKECVPDLVDVDNYGKIIDSFAGAMCRTLGKENYFTKKFAEYYKEYSVDFKAIEEASASTEEA